AAVVVDAGTEFDTIIFQELIDQIACLLELLQRSERRCKHRVDLIGGARSVFAIAFLILSRQRMVGYRRRFLCHRWLFGRRWRRIALLLWAFLVGVCRKSQRSVVGRAFSASSVVNHDVDLSTQP